MVKASLKALIYLREQEPEETCKAVRALKTSRRSSLVQNHNHSHRACLAKAVEESLSSPNLTPKPPNVSCLPIQEMHPLLPT